MTSTYERLHDELQVHLKSALDLADRADREGRDFTPAELKQAEEHYQKAQSLKPRVLQAKADDAWRRKLEALGPDIDAPDAKYDSVTGGPVRHRQSGTPGSFKPTRSDWAKETAKRLTRAATGVGVKALTSGSIDVPSPVTPDAVAFPQQPRVVDLLVDRVPLESNTFNFLQQTARVNNAAPVADNDPKPVSVFTTTEVEGRSRVLAHLSEPFPERYLSDYEALSRWLDDEMREGVLQALEAQVLTGDGTGENFLGVLSTSGTTAVPYTTSLFATIRRARTVMQNLNEAPNAWVLNPNDLEAVDMATDAAGRLYLADGTSGADAIFGGLPRIASTRIPAGTAILADWSTAVLAVREDVKLDMDKSGALFQANQVQIRAEGRFGLGLTRPQAFAVVDLTP